MLRCRHVISYHQVTQVLRPRVQSHRNHDQCQALARCWPLDDRWTAAERPMLSYPSPTMRISTIQSPNIPQARARPSAQRTAQAAPLGSQAAGRRSQREAGRTAGVVASESVHPGMMASEYDHRQTASSHRECPVSCPQAFVRQHGCRASCRRLLARTGGSSTAS